MSKLIKKFENFSASLTGKAEKTIHDVDAGDEEGKEMTLDQFRKCHNYTLSGEWDEREDEKDFDERQKDLEKYKNLSETEKNKYLADLEVSDDTSMKIMKHIKLYEEFNEIESYGDYTYGNGKSYIKYFKMKDTYSLVEFTGLDLESVYGEIGEECVFVDKVYIHPEDNPLILRRFLSKVENYTKEIGYNTIVLDAEPFDDKRLDVSKLINLYEKFGFIVYQELPSGGAYIMYKKLDD